MAVYYFRNTGNQNWGTATNWSLTNGGGATGAVPTAADTANFTNLSGNCTTNVAAVCAVLNFSSYTNTITMTNNITVSGNVTLGASMGIAGTGLLVPNATGTLTSNGKVWTSGLNLRGATSTFTLADNWVVTGNLLIGAGAEAIVINGATFSITTSGNFTTGTSNIISGTATIILNGTGTWSNTSTGAVRNNLTINTSGTVTISGNVYYNTGTLTYTAGTVTTTGSTLNVSTTTTLNTNGITWNNIITTAATSTITLSSNLVFTGTYTITQSGTATITFAGVGIINSPNGTLQLNGTGANLTITTALTHNILNLYFNAGGFAIISSGTWNVYGDLIRNGVSNGSTIMGTVNLVGTGSVLFNGGATGSLTGTLNINTTGTITFGSATFPNVYYENGTLTYITGTVDVSNCNLRVGNITVNTTTTFNTGQIVWNNMFVTGTTSGTGTITLTLTSELNVINLTNSAGTTLNINGTFPLNVYGNFSTGFTTTTGTATINFLGNSTWLGVGVLQNNVNINATSFTLNGTKTYNTRTITYVKGNVITKNSTLALTGASTLIDCHKIVFNIVTITAGVTITMNQFFSGSAYTTSRIQSSTTANYTISFNNNKEKIAKFVNVSNCTITRRLQLILITKNKNPKNFTTNNGIRYINQSPNGFAKNEPSVLNTIGYGTMGYVSDPIYN